MILHVRAIFPRDRRCLVKFKLVPKKERRSSFVPIAVESISLSRKASTLAFTSSTTFGIIVKMVIRLQFLLTLAGVLVSPAAGIAMELQNILENTHRGNEYGYPTDFTRGVMPVGFSFLSCI